MSFISRTKEKISKEIQAMKYNRQLENDPDVVRHRLSEERAKVHAENVRLKEMKQFEQDKAELQELRNNTGLRGKIKNGLGALRSHLDNVKARNEGRSPRIKAVNLLKQGNSPGPGNNPGAFEIRGSGATINDSANPRGMHSGSPSGKSLILQEPGAKKKKSKGVFG